MSLWACNDCGELSGSSKGTPKCYGCGSFDVERAVATGTVETATYSYSFKFTTGPDEWVNYTPGNCG